MHEVDDLLTSLLYPNNVLFNNLLELMAVHCFCTIKQKFRESFYICKSSKKLKKRVYDRIGGDLLLC